MNSLYTFLFGLLSCFNVGRERCTNISDVDNFLISFTLSQGMQKQSSWLRDWGFDNICIKDKLAIIRRLLEYQLDHNKKIIQTVRLANGPDIRPEPLGRDLLGNYYWHFCEGRSSYVVKELVDTDSEPFCEIIKNQSAAHALICHIKQCKTGQSTKAPEKLKKGEKNLMLSCGLCKKTFKTSQIRDESLRLDNTNWFCPNCEQQQLINTVTDLFLSEE